MKTSIAIAAVLLIGSAGYASAAQHSTTQSYRATTDDTNVASDFYVPSVDRPAFPYLGDDGAHDTVTGGPVGGIY